MKAFLIRVLVPSLLLGLVSGIVYVGLHGVVPAKANSMALIFWFAVSAMCGAIMGANRSQGAGRKLLFAIAFAAIAFFVSGLVGMLIVVNVTGS